jgi:hypothetical protein
MEMKEVACSAAWQTAKSQKRIHADVYERSNETIFWRFPGKTCSALEEWLSPGPPYL